MEKNTSNQLMQTVKNKMKIKLIILIVNLLLIAGCSSSPKKSNTNKIKQPSLDQIILSECVAQYPGNNNYMIRTCMGFAPSIAQELSMQRMGASEQQILEIRAKANQTFMNYVYRLIPEFLIISRHPQWPAYAQEMLPKLEASNRYGHGFNQRRLDILNDALTIFKTKHLN